MKYLLFAFLICFVQSINYAQRRSLRFQSGLVHCSFDGTPILNYKNSNYAENQLLNASFGVQYQLILKNQIRFQTDFTIFSHSYKTLDRVVIYNNQAINFYNAASKAYAELQFCFLRNISLRKKIAFNYGIGPSLRLATYVYEELEPIPSCFGPPTTNSLDIGANARAEIAYTPFNWFTIFSQLNLIGFMYRFDDPFGPKPEPLVLNSGKYQLNFPSRFDLSFRVGVGINF
jgi:hypothetical protein